MWANDWCSTMTDALRFSMRWRLVLFTCALLAAKQLHPAAAQESTEYWNQFRGPAGDGVSMALDVPVQFDEAVNVCWKTEIPDSVAPSMICQASAAPPR